MPQAQLTLDSRLAQVAGNWFLESGIQEETGGVARYFQSDTRRNARVSTEITGYAISTLVFLYDRYRTEQYLEAAVRAGKFLTQTAWSPSLRTFPFEHAHNGDAPQPLTYFFDCGIIVRGLLALWRATGESEYLDVATATGESMARDFVAGDTWHPILELPGKYPLQWTDQWSRHPGCYQLKAALAWRDLHETTGDSKFERHFGAALAKTLTTKDEFLPAATPEKTMDRLHAYCYFLEALTHVTDRPQIRDALAVGIQRVSRYLREIRGDFERSDVNAQLLRVRLLAEQSAKLPLDESEAAEEAERLISFQIDSNTKDRGGFWFGRKSGQWMPFINPVSTGFGLQALEWWQDRQAGRTITQALI